MLSSLSRRRFRKWCYEFLVYGAPLNASRRGAVCSRADEDVFGKMTVFRQRESSVRFGQHRQGSR